MSDERKRKQDDMFSGATFPHTFANKLNYTFFAPANKKQKWQTLELKIYYKAMQ